jgi:hypothetical protein
VVKNVVYTCNLKTCPKQTIGRKFAESGHPDWSQKNEAKQKLFGRKKISGTNTKKL